MHTARNVITSNSPDKGSCIRQSQSPIFCGVNTNTSHITNKKGSTQQDSKSIDVLNAF